jgi:uncharacterized protein (TIGR03437 family)
MQDPQRPLPLRVRTLDMRGCARWLVVILCLFLSQTTRALAQTNQAVIVDGSGPWQNDQWSFTVTQFNSILTDAGYTVTTVSPVDVSSAIASGNVLLAVPSLQSLPFDTLTAISNFVSSGGRIMASGGEPFQAPLYLAPNGSYLDAAAYQAAVGSAPPQGPFMVQTLPTLSPWYAQYTTSSGPRVPIVIGRGIIGYGNSARTRVIGDVLAPAATIYSYFMSFQPPPGFTGPANVIQSFIVWLPWPQLPDPDRAQLVAALNAAITGVHLQSAGPSQMVWLPGETITASASAVNMSSSAVQATLQWSIVGSAGAMPQPSIPMPLAAANFNTLNLTIPTLPTGNYTLSFQLMIGKQVVDSIDSPLRILDPTVTREPNQKIQAQNIQGMPGAFYANGQRVFLHGVNFWPRYAAGLDGNFSWLEPQNYDPVQVEADLAEVASLNFNLVNVQYVDAEYANQDGWQPQARSLIDFLERCRSHGIWVRVALPATLGDNAFNGTLNPQLGDYLNEAFLPGNDRVFAYELLWEPYLGMQASGGYDGYVNGMPFVEGAGRSALDPDWRSWVNDQYGSLANAQQIWGIAPPLDSNGQLTNPTDNQFANDGSWRVIVDAYRRFLDDYLGRNIGVVARAIRRLDPDTLLSYRDWSTMTSFGNSNTGYDLGTGAADLDFLSPETYDTSPWPEHREWGFATVYARYKSGGKPVQWVEFGYNVGNEYGTPTSLGQQAAMCQANMQLVGDDGSDADTVWWWPGGYNTVEENDFGIINPDGTPRACALTLAQYGTMFKQNPPSMGSGSPATLTIDRDADARGQYGLFLNWASQYAAARAAGEPVALVDQGTGTDTSTMPLIQVGNVPYSGTGPLKFANTEFGGLRVVCPNLDVTVENNSTVQVPAGAACQITATMINAGEAQWLPASASNGGVVLHSSAGDVPLATALPSLQRMALAPLAVTMGHSTLNLTGRMRAGASESFGEVLRLTLSADPNSTGSCAISLNPSTDLSAPGAGATGTVAITTASGCTWTTSTPLPWVTITPQQGTGSGQATYTIQPNIGPTRQMTVMIAGHPFTVSQAAAAMNFVSAPTLSTTSLNFGSQTLAVTSGTQTVKLTNTAASALTISLVTIGGTSNADFAQSNNCGTSVAAGASCTIMVSFTPSSVGTRLASLFVTASTGGGPLAIALSGTGLGTGTTPTIQAIVDAWNYTPGIAPGLWVTIGGTNFAPFAVTANFGENQLLPTALGGASVTFNGTPAALLYVNPTQVNALVPSSVQPGPVQVVVEANGVSSNAFPITAKATQPAIYAVPNAAGTTYFVTAALEGTGFLVGNSAVDSRVVRAVLPGDVVDLYMIGLGATANPSDFITNQEFSGAFAVSALVTATVNGESAPVIFAGLTSPGLYLVRISIPSDLQPGSPEIQVSTGNPSAGGAQTSALLALAIGTTPASLIQNGNFGSALAGTWSLIVNSAQGAAATVETTTVTSATSGGSSAQINVTSAASDPANNAAVQFSQTGLTLAPGQVYRLMFWAKSDVARTMHFDVMNTAAEASVYSSVVALTTTWQQYVVYVQATAAVTTAQVDFDFGDQTGNAWLDSVVLEGSTP